MSESRLSGGTGERPLFPTFIATAPGPYVVLDMGVVGLALVGIVVGAVVRRWEAMLAAGLVPLYFVGLDWGLWGDGTGDLWGFAAFVTTVVAACSVAIGVAVGRMAFEGPRR